MNTTTSEHGESTLPFKQLGSAVPDKIKVINLAGVEHDGDKVGVIEELKSLKLYRQATPAWNASCGPSEQPLALQERFKIDSFESAICAAESRLLGKQPSLAAILLVNEDVHERIKKTNDDPDALGIYASDASQSIDKWLDDKSPLLRKEVGCPKFLPVIILFVQAIRKTQEVLQENGTPHPETHDVLKLVLRHELGHSVDPLLEVSGKYRKECFAQVFCWITSSPERRAIMQAMHQQPSMYKTYQAIVKSHQDGENADPTARLGIGFMWWSEAEHFNDLKGLIEQCAADKKKHLGESLHDALDYLIGELKILGAQEEGAFWHLKDVKESLQALLASLAAKQKTDEILAADDSLGLKPLSDTLG